MPAINFDDPQYYQAPDASGAISFDDPAYITPPSTAEDLAKSAGTGLVKGAASFATTVPAISSLLERGADYLFQPILGSRPQGVPGPAPLSDAVVKAAGDAATAATGNYQPQTTAGKYAESVGEAAPAMLAGPMGLAGRLPTVAGIGRGILAATGSGIGSEAAGEAIQNRGYGPAAEVGARILGGGVGMAAPGLLSRSITPLPANAERMRLLGLADQEGIYPSLTAGQITGNKPLQWAESVFGDTIGAGGKSEAAKEAMHQAYTSNIMEKAGAPPGTLATPDELKQTREALQSTYQDIYKNGKMDLTSNKLGQDLMNVANDYDTSVATQQQNPIVHREIEKLINTPGSTMSGQQYQTWRTRLRETAKPWQGTPEGTALNNLRQVIDENMARSLPPEDAARLADNHRRYAVYKTAEAAANRPTELATRGYLDPKAIDREVSSWNPSANAVGTGTMADIAQVGTGLLGPLPQSGTAPRAHVMHTLQALGAGAAGLLGDNPNWHMALGSIAGPAIGGRALMSPLVQAYLGNQAMTRAGLANLSPTISQGILGSALINRERLPFFAQ